jgi:hypothetical protein
MFLPSSIKFIKPLGVEGKGGGVDGFYIRMHINFKAPALVTYTHDKAN